MAAVSGRNGAGRRKSDSGWTVGGSTSSRKGREKRPIFCAPVVAAFSSITGAAAAAAAAPRNSLFGRRGSLFPLTSERFVSAAHPTASPTQALEYRSIVHAEQIRV